MVKVVLISIEPLLLQALTRLSVRNGATGLDVDFAVQTILSAGYKAHAKRLLCVMSHPAQPTRASLCSRFRADIDRMSVQDTRSLHRLVSGLIAAGVPVTSEHDFLALDLVHSSATAYKAKACTNDPVLFQCQRRNLAVLPFFNRSTRLERPWQSVPPDLIPDYFALTGSSDTWPVVPAADARSALALLRRYGRLERIFDAHADAHFLRGRRDELLTARQLLSPREAVFNPLSLAVML